MRKEITALIVIAAAVAIMTITINTGYRREERYLDAEELHYDADGYFIIVDKETSQIGFYDATRPLLHIHGQDVTDCVPGMYRMYKLQSGVCFMAENEDGISFAIELTDKQQRIVNVMPDETPVLVRR